MNAEFERQEREIDRQLAALAWHLRSPAPGRECVACVRAVVGAEARRLQRRQRLLMVLRASAGVAAALALALGLSLPRGSTPSGRWLDAGEKPDAVFVDWIDALGESGEQFTRLIEDDWLLEGFGPGGDENGDGGPLDSLEESLERFERMMET